MAIDPSDLAQIDFDVTKFQRAKVKRLGNGSISFDLPEGMSFPKGTGTLECTVVPGPDGGFFLVAELPDDDETKPA
jgi:hypothetical protein